jgi:hypothetical protein
MPRRFLPLVIVLFGTLPAAALPRADDLGWTEFRNERFGLALRSRQRFLLHSAVRTRATVTCLKRVTARVACWLAHLETPIASRHGRTRPSLRDSLIPACALTTRR